MVDAAATSPRTPGRPPRSAPVDLRAFALERLLAGLAQAREATRTLSVADGHPAAPVHAALVADVTQAETTARLLRRALEAAP